MKVLNEDGLGDNILNTLTFDSPLNKKSNINISNNLEDSSSINLL